jgi:hypothetical protein
MEKTSENTALDIGRTIGQGQAFGLLASKCSAAQAQCLQAIREQRHFEALGLTWEDLCRNQLGISRSCADQLIRNFQEFGEAYFRLSRILHISDTTYREISSAVTGETIEIDGEAIPILPENATRIRRGIAQLRAGLQRAARSNHPRGAIILLHDRLDQCFREISELARISTDPGEQAALRGLVTYSRRKLSLIRFAPESEPRHV